jgi:hypothetical protein
MESVWTKLGAVDPRALLEARTQAHHAVQWVTRAARANLPPAPDDSHSNLGWDYPRRALVSHDLVAADGTACRAGLALDSMTLVITRGTGVLGDFALDGRRDADAGTWIDDLASRAGLMAPSKVTLPYALPAHPVGSGGRYSCASGHSDFAELARWFEAGNELLQETRSPLAAIKPGFSAVRCWPHHFDVANRLTLAAGNPETAPAIGIGLSPGDDHYAQPYFYVSPWPAPPMPALPGLPAPGHWHTVGFVGAIATAEAVLALAERHAAARRFIVAAIDISRRLLGA